VESESVERLVLCSTDRVITYPYQGDRECPTSQDLLLLTQHRRFSEEAF
jgi:hypothetical protein